MNLTIQPQYIPIQDISLSIGIVQYYGCLNGCFFFVLDQTKLKNKQTVLHTDKTFSSVSLI